jgi:hypothetical protein
MKKLLFCLFVVTFWTQVSSQVFGSFVKEDCNVRNLSLFSRDSSHILYNHIIDEERLGILDLHPFTLDELGGWDNFVDCLKSDSNITFVYVGSTASRLMEGTFHRYAQYYKGIEVVDGGFTITTDNTDVTARPDPPCPGCPEANPCDEVLFLSPYIYENININVNSSITVGQIANILNITITDIVNQELKIIQNITNNCEYRLAYMTIYKSENEGSMVAWLDAHSGDFLYNTTFYSLKDAPTADHGIQYLNDIQVGNKTILKNHRLSCYDMTGNYLHGNSLDLGFYSNDIPESPANRNWIDSDADHEVFQLFWMTDQVIDVFADRLGINFTNVRVGFHAQFTNAYSAPGGLPNSEAKFIFGAIEGMSFVEYDQIAHEMGHAIINQYISPNLIEGGSLHEGLADIFGVYIEYVLQDFVIDWVMGDDMPRVIRDLENTSRNCFTDIKNNNSNHERGEALGHWFYLCVTGSLSDNIPSMNIEEVMGVILDALPNIGKNADYHDLMRATLTTTARRFSTCSNQFLTILRAWEKICVNTNHRMVNSNEPCIAILGNTVVCEENQNIYLYLTLNHGLNTDFGVWRLLGRNNTSFKSVRGMQGNLQYGGESLEIYEIPKMLYYPQTLTIKFWHPQLGDIYPVRVRLMDCNSDDPSCYDYYSSSMPYQLENFTYEYNDGYNKVNVNYENTEIESDWKLIVYNLMGNKILQTLDRTSTDNISKILIYTYWDKNGQLVKTKKVFASE